MDNNSDTDMSSIVSTPYATQLVKLIFHFQDLVVYTHYRNKCFEILGYKHRTYWNRNNELYNSRYFLFSPENGATTKKKSLKRSVQFYIIF